MVWCQEEANEGAAGSQGDSPQTGLASRQSPGLGSRAWDAARSPPGSVLHGRDGLGTGSFCWVSG